MFRSLHMKLMLIMVLLILALMTVVGSFLVNSVVSYYLTDFYEQMQDIFSDTDFSTALQTPGENEEDPVAAVKALMEANVGSLGVDNHNRNYYILDQYARYLDGSDSEGGQLLEMTPNLTAALNGQSGYRSDVAVDYMDVAVPFQRGDGHYIIYIRDNRETVTQLNNQLFLIIVEALIFGLFISILLSFLLSKTMIVPIRRLTAGAERVASGDFSHKLEVQARDEIGVLTNTFNDMASQLQATIREVENERNKLDTLFLHMTDGVVAFSREGTVIHSNPAASDMLGREIRPEDGYDSLFGDILSMDKLLEQPDFVEGERQVNGRFLELLMAPYDREGENGGALVVIHDVTQQRKTEEERKEFVANVSHELRTPLTNIRSYAETLADAGDDMPPAMRKNFFEVILNESDRMTHIVQDLLTLSRFDSGRSELKLAPFSFEKVVRDVYSAVLLEAGRHGHRLTLELEEELPEVVGDRERIAQVMMNVVSNSIKYTPDGGEIRIRAGRETDGRRVWMEVSDNGIGIPEEDQGRIFERFYRVDKARSRESGGTGLGLAIAKEIVDRHKGVLGLTGHDGPGTTVRLTLWIEGPEHA